MINFQYARASDVADAVRQIAADPKAKFIAGGTNLIDLMKYEVEHPARLIDISRLPLNTVEETSGGGLRIGALVPNSDLAYHPLPGETQQIDTNLQPGEIVTAIELPPRGFAANYSYLKIRDRLSYAFALVSVAATLELEGGRIKEARLALGGVAHKPWRDPAAEAALRGQAANQATFTGAADLLLRDAKGFEHNAFKIDLVRGAIVRAL